jgi:hypothetical protein
VILAFSAAKLKTLVLPIHALVSWQLLMVAIANFNKALGSKDSPEQRQVTSSIY